MSLPPIFANPGGVPDAIGQGVAAMVAIMLVGTLCALTIIGRIDATIVVALAASVVTAFYAGQSSRQVNGAKVDALTTAVLAVHRRLDQAGIPPARDGTG